jgi:hypothetical protein
MFLTAALLLMNNIMIATDTLVIIPQLGAGVGTGATVFPMLSDCSIIHVFPVPLTPGSQTPT